jgi:hypothetical protein
MNCIWENYIQDKVKKVKEKVGFQEQIGTLPLAQSIQMTKDARAAAMDLVVKRKQAFYGLSNAWQELQDKKEAGVIILQPWVDVVEHAQTELKKYPRETVVKAVRYYCGCLSNIATLYAIAEQGIYDTEKLNDLIYFF